MDGKRGSGVGSGVRLESSNLLYSHRKMTKIGLELLQSNKIIPRTPPPLPPQRNF